MAWRCGWRCCGRCWAHSPDPSSRLRRTREFLAALRARPGDPDRRAVSRVLRTERRPRGHPVRASRSPGRARRAVGHWPQLGKGVTRPSASAPLRLALGPDLPVRAGSSFASARPSPTDHAGCHASVEAEGSVRSRSFDDVGKLSAQATRSGPKREADKRRANRARYSVTNSRHQSSALVGSPRGPRPPGRKPHPANALAAARTSCPRFEVPWASRRGRTIDAAKL